MLIEKVELDKKEKKFLNQLLAEKAAEEKVNGATLGPLIHNPQFIAELESKGIACKEDLAEFTAGETVIFRSHGVGPEVYQKAEAMQLNIIDATCPNVRMAQKKAAQAAEDGYFPVIVGEKNHPEVKSIKKWAGENAIVVEYLEDISNIPQKDKYAVIIQTTFELQKFEEILAAMQKERMGEYRVERTICLATSQRQNAAMKLAGEVDAFVVVGGRNSANTRHLYELVAGKCPKAYHIETAAELDADMFRDCIKIGITAGASTPDRLIKEAIVAMENMDFGSLLAQSEEVSVYPGKVLEATVIQLDKDGVYVDFGYMREGIVTYPEWSLTETAEELMATIKVGDVVEVKVIPGTSKDDFVRMSKVKAERDAAWKNVAELAEGEKRAATVKVIRIIKNKAKNIVGLAVAVEGVEGFMPASHVELKRVEDFTGYVGQEMEAEIIEVDLEKKRIVVSRRDLLKAEKEAKEKDQLVFGPFSADGFFGSAAWTKYDGVLCMFHDQAMISFKILAVDGGVNFTAGLPVVRTAPDHGTGYDIANKNIADANSFRHAIYLAIDVLKNREETF